MIKFFRSNATLIYLILTIVFAAPLFIRSRSIEDRYSSSELFNKDLCNINSIDAALLYIDKQVGINKINYFDTLKYVQATSTFTKDRFFHGLARYTVSENWIANFGAKCLWDHMSAIVDPDDIMKYCGGLCSQQTIVFMEILKRRGIKTRSVGLGYKEGPGHFLCEVFYENAWHLHDVTLEPQWTKVTGHHKSMEYYQKNIDSLFVAYESRLSRGNFDKIMEKVEYGKVNEFPAKNMRIFHNVTKAFTYALPILSGLVCIRSYRRKNKASVKAYNL